MIPKWIVNFVDGIRGLLRIPPVVIDGTLYVSIAMFTALQSSFGSDEAAKFIALQTLFWLKTATGALLAAALSLKMFRSTSYGDHLKPKESTGNTEIYTKTETTKTEG